MKKWLIIIPVLLLAWVAWSRTQGVTLVLTNAGTATMRSVIVMVTGQTYRIGDLAPGSSASLALRPTGESHIELLLSDNRLLRIDCYFERGYDGRIAATVTPERVVAVDSQVRPGVWF